MQAFKILLGLSSISVVVSCGSPTEHGDTAPEAVLTADTQLPSSLVAMTTAAPQRLEEEGPTATEVPIGDDSDATAVPPQVTPPRGGSLSEDDFIPPGTASRIHTEYEGPTTELLDWATYGDAYVTITIVDAFESPASDNPDGIHLGKTIVASVDEILWQRTPDRVPTTTVTFETIGWVVSNGTRQPVLVNNSPEWNVGDRYAALLELGDDGWTPLADDTVTTIGTDGRIDIPAPVPGSGVSLGEAMLFSAGKTPVDVAAALKEIAGDEPRSTTP